jgi:hypothetical protein
MELNGDETRYKNVIALLKQLKKAEGPDNFTTDLMRRINSSEDKEEIQIESSFWHKNFKRTRPAYSSESVDARQSRGSSRTADGVNDRTGRFVPSIAIGTAVILIFLIMNLNQGNYNNPLLTDPKVREDIISSANLPFGQAGSFSNQIVTELKKKKESLDVERKPGNENDRSKGNFAGKQSGLPSGVLSSPNKSNSLIRRAGIQSDQSTFRLKKMSASMQNTMIINRSGLNFRQVNIVPAERIKVMELKHKMEMLFRRTSPANK